MRNIRLPEELTTVLSGETRDFTVKAGREKPLAKSFSLIVFGVIWTAFTSVFVFAFLGPLFFGNEVHFSTNGKPTVASPDNLEPIIFPAVFIGVFVLIGIAILSSGIYSMFKKGGYFVGTPTRLVNYRKGKIRSIDWEQFSGDIRVSGNDQKGNITLGMRTGKMVSRKNRSSQYVPDMIYISEVRNVFNIEKLCRQRIKENDPTPAVTSSN